MTHARIDLDQLSAEGRALRELARSLLGGDLRNVVSGDDLVQEAHLAAMRAGPAVQLSGAWLAGTVRNLAKMLRRGAARRRRREDAVARMRLAATNDPAELAVQAEGARDVAAAVAALAEPFRSAIVLRYWHGLSPLAIAEQLGEPHHTVRSRLQRGLERLRERLDARHGSRGAWLGPLAQFAGGRETVVTGAAVLSWSGILGVLMQGKLLVGAVVTMVAAAVWLGRPAPDAGAQGRVVEPGGAVAAAVAAPAAGADAQPEAQREAAVATIAAAAAEPPFDPLPVRVPPWTARFLVVDSDQMPVAGATITIWPGKKVERPAEMRQRMGGPRHSYSGREEPPALTVVTDFDGRAQPVLDLENVVVAAVMPGYRDSREAVVWHQRAVPTTLQIVTESTVRGIVLHADGTPAAGAVVTAGASGDFDAIARNPEPVTTDARGRFALPVQQHGTWVFTARLAGQDSFYRRRTIRDDRTELVLQFPGAIAVVGRVVDPAGRPVAGADVRAWREPPRADEPAEDDEQCRSVTTDLRGEFVLPVRSFARYQLVAAAEGHCRSALGEVVTSVERPRAEVALALQAPVPIRGRVLRPDGAPFAKVQVWAEAEFVDPGGAASRPGVRELFGERVLTRTTAAGDFELPVQPGTTWTLSLRPDPKRPLLVRELRGVAAGAQDVAVQMTAADLQSCIVRGAVVRAADGSGLSNFEVTLVTYGEHGYAGGSEVRIVGSRFESEPLPVGRRFGFWIEPPRFQGMGDFGWTEVITETLPGVVDLEVRVAPWAELPVRVLGPGDQPVRNATVRAATKAWPGRSLGAQHVDAAGRATLRWLGAGTNRVVVTRGASEVVFDQEVSLSSGQNPELVVRLAK